MKQMALIITQQTELTIRQMKHQASTALPSQILMVSKTIRQPSASVLRISGGIQDHPHAEEERQTEMP